jgi:hypothetical protein
MVRPPMPTQPPEKYERAGRIDGGTLVVFVDGHAMGPRSGSAHSPALAQHHRPSIISLPGQADLAAGPAAHVDLSHYLDRAPLSVHPEATLAHLADLFVKLGPRYLIVKGAGARLMGLVTKKDLLHGLHLEEGEGGDLHPAAFMRPGASRGASMRLPTRSSLSSPDAAAADRVGVRRRRSGSSWHLSDLGSEAEGLEGEEYDFGPASPLSPQGLR